MDLAQVKILVQSGESTSVEFKASTSELRKACQSSCAFLNAKGGVVLIGVNNSANCLQFMMIDWSCGIMGHCLRN